MESDENYVRSLLEDEAAKARPLDVSLDVLDDAVRRRRGVRTLAVATTAVAAVVAVAAGGVALLRYDAPNGGPAGSSPAQTGTVTQPTLLPHPIACGHPLDPPLIRKGNHDLALSIVHATKSGAGAVGQVTVNLSAGDAVRLTVPGLTPLQVLLLRDGLVVDRIGTFQLAPDGPVTDWIAATQGTGTPGNTGAGGIGYTWDVAPGAPHVVTVTGPGHCPGANWPQAWAAPQGYTLLAVMSEPRSPAEPVPAPTRTQVEPLLVATAVPLGQF